jgi:MSHA biogenesis protein MshN
MGFFQMSLINRMLQDLDARSSDRAGTANIHAQVRPVSEPGGIRPVWWIALVVLAILIGAGISWFWLSRLAPAVTAPATPTGAAAAPALPPPQLDLKYVPDPTAAPPQVQADSAGSGKNANLPITEAPAAVAQQAPPAIVSSGVPPQSPPAVAAQAPAVAVPAVPPEPVAVPAKPAAQKKRAPEERAKAPDVGVPANTHKQVKELTPQQRAENEFRRATLLMQQGRMVETMAGLEQALQLDPLHATARQTLVGLLVDSKRHDEAMRKLHEGLALDPSQAGMAMILARLQVEKGELRPAVETLQHTLPYSADRPDYQAFLAALLQRQLRHKDAIDHYLLALRNAPQNGLWWMGIGISYQAENRLTEAQEAFTRAKASNALSSELLAFVEQKLKQLPR